MTNGSHTRAGSPVPAPLGRAQLWHLDPAPLRGGPGSRGAPAPGCEQWLLPSRAPFPKGGPCPPGWRCGDRSSAPLGRAPSRGWRSPQLTSCLFVSKTRRQNAHPAPIGAPVLSPQSPSFALLRQHHGLARSRSQEKLRKQAWFLEPAATVETQPESSAAWKSYHLGSLRLAGIGLCVCVCIWEGCLLRQAGGVTARGPSPEA